MEALTDLFFLFSYLLQGTGVTLGVTLIALSTGFLFGTLLAVMRVYGSKAVAGFAATYSTLIRAVPVVVIIFILFFVIASVIDLSPFLSGALALGFASAAYQSEVFRGAILSVPGGQMMAARAIGMSRLKAIRYIILPQAIRLAIPPWSNEAAIVLKDSSLVFVIGVPEILRRAQYVSARTLEPFVAFGAAAAIYFVLTFLANRSLDYFERRYRILM
ncbi:MAG TPA: amino acid ABC transporter permease [Anaerolineales bacterium]|nr:amino acid ABC transporter permease [Anaerolineales bacterium]